MLFPVSQGKKWENTNIRFKEFWYIFHLQLQFLIICVFSLCYNIVKSLDLERKLTLVRQRSKSSLIFKSFLFRFLRKFVFSLKYSKILRASRKFQAVSFKLIISCVFLPRCVRATLYKNLAPHLLHLAGQNLFFGNNI